jgi:hypothetical protein
MTRAITRWLLLAVFAAPLASAQPAAAPEPIVTATIDPPRVVVGQKATLLVTVLAPNYMPSPPILPEFQLRNVVTRSLGAINQVETRDGVTYAGVRYEFAIFPQELGSFAIAGQKVTVTYAADPPQSRTATIELPRLAFEGFIPDAAQGLDPFLAATSLSVGQVLAGAEGRRFRHAHGDDQSPRHARDAVATGGVYRNRRTCALSGPAGAEREHRSPHRRAGGHARRRSDLHAGTGG